MITGIKKLEGWQSLSEAAEQIGMSRQGLHFRARQGTIPAEHVRYVGKGNRAMVLIADAYIQAEAASE